MGRWVIVAFVLAALIAVPAATPQVVVGQTVYLAPLLPAGATTEFAVSCPSGYFAVSAGVSRAAAGVTTLGIRPIGPRRFAFRFVNPATNANRRVTAAAACRRIKPAESKGPYLRFTLLRRLTVRVGPSSRRQARLICPSGTVPAGAGFDLRRGGAALSVRQQTQTLRDLSFTVVNRATVARPVSLYGSCLTVVRRVGASAGTLQAQLTTFTVPVRSGAQVVTRLCPRSWLSLGVGYSVPPGIALDGAAAVARTGRWSLTSAAQNPLLATLQLVCARLG